jgi:hypothetical protein
MAAPAVKINNEGQILLTATRDGRTTSVLLTPQRETRSSLITAPAFAAAMVDSTLGRSPAILAEAEGMRKMRPRTDKMADTGACAILSLNAARPFTTPAGDCPSGN